MSYRWSSLPSYAGRSAQRPAWLEVTRVLGELGYEDRAKDRRAYAERMEGRAREGMEEATLQEMRRGWMLGGEEFRDRVLDWMEKRGPGAGRARKVRREEADADHGQRQAERIIREMLEALKVPEGEVLAARKGDWRKRVIAEQVRAKTSVSLRWLAGRLRMGSEGHLSRVTSHLEDLADHPGWRCFCQSAKKNARKKD